MANQQDRYNASVMEQGTPYPTGQFRYNAAAMSAPPPTAAAASGWRKLADGRYVWAGDPSIHPIGMTQASNFDPLTGANMNWGSAVIPTTQTGGPPISAAPPAAAAPAGPSAQDTALAHANTNRTLELLRQQLGTGERVGIGSLRQNLAQRGIMDSGSLGAGIGRISNDYQSRMAQGTMAAANNENDTLLNLLQQERQRQYGRETQQAGFANDRSLLALQQQYAQQNRPTFLDYLLGTAGQVAGTAGGYYLGKKIAG